MAIPHAKSGEVIDIRPRGPALAQATVQCLKGRITFSTSTIRHDLAADQMLYLSSAEPHSLRGLEDASVLVTILLQQ